MAGIISTEAVNDVGYKIKRNGVYLAGKEFIMQMGGREAITLLGGASVGFGITLPALTTLGLTAAVSAGMTQMDYLHERDRLKEFYAQEIAAKLGKKEVTDKDLTKLAEQNGTIRDAIDKAKDNRNFSVIMSFTASLLSLAAVVYAGPAFKEMNEVATFLLKSALGLAVYHSVKKAAHWVSDMIFGVDKETAHDRIVTLQKERDAGKIISPQQVLSVFIIAQYGDRFEKFSEPLKQKAVEDIVKRTSIMELTDNINSGKINVGELAFAVEGEISGVENAPGAVPKKQGMLEKAVSKLAGMFTKKERAAGEVMPLPLADLPLTVAAYEEERPVGGGFVQRLGLAQLDTRQGYQKRIEQQAQLSAPGVISQP